MKKAKHLIKPQVYEGPTSLLLLGSFISETLHCNVVHIPLLEAKLESVIGTSWFLFRMALQSLPASWLYAVAHLSRPSKCGIWEYFAKKSCIVNGTAYSAI